MRVFLKKNITAYSGKDSEEDVVYSAHNQGNVCIARNYTIPKECPQHLVFKANSDTIASLWAQVTTAYKNDLKTYAKLLNENFPERLKAGCYSVFIRILYAYSIGEGIQFSTMNITSLRTSSVKSVASAIDNNFISKVETSETLNQTM